MTIANKISAEQLRSVVERIETLEDEKIKISDQVKEVYAESKVKGFDVKALRQIIRIRKMKKEELAQQDELLDLYRNALGM